MEKNKEALWSAGTLFVEVGRVAGVVIGEPRSGGRRGSSWSPATVVSIKKKSPRSTSFIRTLFKNEYQMAQTF